MAKLSRRMVGGQWVTSFDDLEFVDPDSYYGYETCSWRNAQMTYRAGATPYAAYKSLEATMSSLSERPS